MEGVAAAGHVAGWPPAATAPAAWARARACRESSSCPASASTRTAVGPRQVVRQNQFDAIVLNDTHAIVNGGLVGWQRRIVRVGIRHNSFPVKSAWKYTRLVDHLVCVSQTAREECRKAGLGDDRTSLIYCGLPEPRVDPQALASVRQMFAAAGGDSSRHILGLGRLLKLKGFDATIAATQLGVRQGKNWHLWIAGEGPEQVALSTQAAQLGIAHRVHLLGFRTDVAELLAAADLFVSASHSEGVPFGPRRGHASRLPPSVHARRRLSRGPGRRRRRTEPIRRNLFPRRRSGAGVCNDSGARNARASI